MPTIKIEDKCVFFADVDQCTFRTRTNGDKISFEGVHLKQNSSAALAYFIQSGKKLKIIIKEK